MAAGRSMSRGEGGAFEDVGGFAAFGIGDEKFQREIAVLTAEVVGEAHVIFDDWAGDEFPFFLSGEELVGEEEAAAVALVAYDAGDVGHFAYEGGLERIWKEDREIKFCAAETAGEIEEALAGFFGGLAGAIGDELIGPGEAGVEGLDVSLHHVGDVGFGE